MKLRHLLTVNIFIALFFGGTCTFFPRFVFGLYGIVPDAAAIWVTGLVGGSILGFATLMWYGIKTVSAETRRAIAIALLVQDATGFIASLVFQLTGKVNFFGWLSLAMYCILALGYAYFLFVRKERI